MAAGIFRHEELYRGATLLQRLEALRITICGAGALGSNLADALARQGASKLRIIDHDRVEEHNVGTQIYGQGDVGAFKVEALRKHLFRATGVEIEAVRKQMVESNAQSVLKQSDLVIDCFDNAASRSVVQNCARQTDTPTLHVGLNVDYCEVIWDEHYRVPGDVRGDVCDYPLARNLVLLAVVVAAESVVRFVDNGERIDRSGTLRDLAIAPLERA
jgi:molybdopterin/thiamine biosynthesis adenylyltransferase